MGKYRNQPCVVDGIRFASKREARRWSELRLLERAAHIRDLRRQVRFDLVVNDQHVCLYLADFTYVEANKLIVEDAKGLRTKEYQLKKKLMQAIHNIEIREV